MPREFSAGGVCVRRLRGRWMLAAIRPGGKPEGTWALPKGLVDPGEDPAATAVREVAEETGVRGRLVGKLGDVRYVYTRGGERIFKVVSFFLVRYRGGRSATYRRRSATRWPRPAGCLSTRRRGCSRTAASGRWRRRPSQALRDS